MSKRLRRKQRADKGYHQVAERRLPVRQVALLLVLAGLAAGTLFLLPSKHTGAQSGTPAAATESASTPKAQKDFSHLQGRWQRPDGGYVLEIKSIEPGGRMTAAYFNPRPINVSVAEAALDVGTLKVFIELRDVNYPGATYHLTYDPASDQLRGVYFQPALQQRFDVFFVRMK